MIPSSVEATPPRRPQRVAAALAGSPIFWLLAIAVLFSWPIVRSLRALHALPPPRPVLGRVAEFNLVDQNGRAYSSAELRGRVWVAHFLRARSKDPLAAKMSELQHRSRGLGEAFHLVSFTLDPEHDRPAVLARVAREHRASRRAWSFLTGSRDAVQAAVRTGFGVELDRPEPKPLARLVLVDQQLRIRGFYPMRAGTRVDAVLRDAGLLVNRRD